ncbi:hypothetical protein N7532_003191 [Penicillium argentinense]|uniref:CwfJ domain protein n=1 Tax=Penicillium argentinense TaxID=1131581 RepID=A0A9W9KF01_9EURO|nr:uncharacterized protein N7532_003191 [Penicillium argentinense]KAJ5102662.1 hypothetical protein N7532_003191 [Penicillium argentinense]
MTLKIIVLGSLNCQLRAAFTKLTKLHAKQNFSCAILVGNVFGDGTTESDAEEISALLSGLITVPIPTYFTLGDKPLPPRIVERIEADGEVCPHLYFLGKRGTLKTLEGVRISALGGNLNDGDANAKPETNASGKFQPTYTESDARALFGVHSADILITNQWPKGIRTGSDFPADVENSTVPTEVQCVSDITATLKPRYHFCSSEAFFYEREPFFHLPTEDEPNAKPLTRFISMAPFGSKHKAMYAFAFDVNEAPPLTVPAGATASPLRAIQPKGKGKGLPSQKESFKRFATTDDDHNQRPHKRRQRQPPPGPDQCFFCLSNPNIAMHLITSIGNESYLTTAKGPLPPKNFFPNLGFPGHILIIPLPHTPTLNSISEAETRANTYAEMERYHTALHNMVVERSGGKLGSVVWEVSRGNGIHTHWQFLPVPIELINDGLVEAAFMVEGDNLKYPRFSTISTTDSSAEPGDFFRVCIWGANAKAEKEKTEEKEAVEESSSPAPNKTLNLDLSPDFRFDLQFGRRVMAKLLELDSRMDWRAANQSQAEEEADAEAFKAAFKKYDFSME